MTMGAIAIGVGAAAVVGGASSAIMGANAAKSGAEAQQNAANAAEGELSAGYNTVAGLEAPSTNLGYGAEDILANLYGINSPTNAGVPGTAATGGMSGGGIQGQSFAKGATTGAGAGNTPNFSSFYNSPGYQYAIQQATRGTNATASAGGNLFSSGTLNSLNQNIQGVASGQYNNYVTQLMNMAQLGQGAVNTTAGAAQQTAANEANVTTGAGAAQAAGITGAAGAVQGGVNTAIQGSTAAAGLYSNYNPAAAGAPNASGVAMNAFNNTVTNNAANNGGNAFGLATSV